MGSYPIAAAADDGTEIGGVWNGAANPMVIGPNDRIGLRFTTLPINSFTSSGVPTKPVSRTQAATTITALNLVVQVNPSVSGTITVEYVDQLDPQAFGASPNLPSERTVVTAGTLAVNAGIQTATIPLFTQTATLPNFSTFLARHRGSNWNAKVALVMRWGTAGTLTVTPQEGAVDPTLTTTELGEVTGINKHWNAHSRADRCPRCGTLTVREKLVADGFVRDLLVCRDCWDPPDFHRQWGRRNVGREREGIND